MSSVCPSLAGLLVQDTVNWRTSLGDGERRYSNTRRLTGVSPSKRRCSEAIPRSFDPGTSSGSWSRLEVGLEVGHRRRVSLSQVTEQLLHHKRRGSFDLAMMDMNSTERSLKLARSQKHRSAHDDIIEEHQETSLDI